MIDNKNVIMKQTFVGLGIVIRNKIETGINNHFKKQLLEIQSSLSSSSFLTISLSLFSCLFSISFKTFSSKKSDELFISLCLHFSSSIADICFSFFTIFVLQ